MLAETHCPFCSSLNTQRYHVDSRRSYSQCTVCALVFVPSVDYLSAEEERAEYDLHENEVTDERYRKFLSRLSVPLVARLEGGACGLDFGCGPAPALAHVLRESGFQVSLYDSFYEPDVAVFDAQYDFVCATEVVEHLHRPGWELDRLWDSLRVGGWLGIMTKMVRDQEAFSRWHYKNDPTHVCFFSVETWDWWARQRGAQLEIVGSDVVLLRRQE